VWLNAGPQESHGALASRLENWLAYHQREGIEAVSDGVITLRKRSGGANWLRFDDTPQRVGPCGASVERGFAAVDFLQATADDKALLEARLQLVPEVRWEQRLTPTAEGWEVQQHQLYVASGLSFRGDVDPRCLALVDRCRGERTVREVLDSLAQESGQPVDFPQFLPVVRGLVEQGFLQPA
jgi:hypothetical protein